TTPPAKAEAIPNPSNLLFLFGMNPTRIAHPPPNANSNSKPGRTPRNNGSPAVYRPSTSVKTFAYRCSATTSCRPYFVNHTRNNHPISNASGKNPNTNQIVAPRHSAGNTFCCPRKNDPD